MGAVQCSANSEKQAESKAPPPPPPVAPHMFKEIIATAPDSEERNPDPAALEGKVYLLEGNRKKYWVKKNRNHFMVLARGLSNVERYWSWRQLQEEGTEVAELRLVNLLLFHGKMEMSHLTPGVVYRVVLEMMMKQSSYGWSLPLKIRLKTPYGSIVQERTEDLRDKPREQWLDIPVGQIKAHKGQRGDLFFSFSQTDDTCKKGLVVKGVKITPRSESYCF